MSSSNRRTLLCLLAVAPLAACGFTPVYGRGGAGNALRGRVLVEPPDTRLGFVLVARLEDRLGRVSTPDYVLTFDIETSERGLAITGTDDITRNNIDGTLRFRVTEAATNVQVEAGDVATFTAYSTTGSPVATAAARRDAEDRLVVALADQLVSRLLSAVGNWA